MANGVATICDRKYHFQDFFNKDELIIYSNETDLIEKIKYYKNNENELSKIGKKGRFKYFKLFNNKLVTNYMIGKSLDLSFDKRDWMK